MYVSYSQLCSPKRMSNADTDVLQYTCPNLPYPTIPKKKYEIPTKNAFEIPTKNAFEIPKRTIENHQIQKWPPELIDSNSLSESFSTLLPVMDPVFNLREICKQCILLEDHLSQPEKRCSDCCTKHFLTIEALAEEAITLDKEHKHVDDLYHLVTRVRELQKEWIEKKEDCHKVAQGLREIRKKYMVPCFNIIHQAYNPSTHCTSTQCRILK